MNPLQLSAILLFVAFSQSVFSAEIKHEHGREHHKNHKHEDASALAQKVSRSELLIKVKGMVCAFCAQGIEKNFNAREEVKNTKVDLDRMTVRIELNKGKSLSEAAIKEIVTGAGFAFEGIKE